MWIKFPMLLNTWLVSLCMHVDLETTVQVRHRSTLDQWSKCSLILESLVEEDIVVDRLTKVVGGHSPHISHTRARNFISMSNIKPFPELKRRWLSRYHGTPSYLVWQWRNPWRRRLYIILDCVWQLHFTSKWCITHIFLLFLLYTSCSRNKARDNRWLELANIMSSRRLKPRHVWVSEISYLLLFWLMWALSACRRQHTMAK